ncbi:YcjX family protein [Rhizobium sp.]|uniref:YcjX family protein n=1 Tax=Rhizobium sp. TaxID=391 RepID=UPI0028AA9B5C
MPPSLTSLTDSALIAFDNLADRASTLTNPTLRLGVTGLSRAGKTVFISSLVHNLLNGGRLPLFEAMRSGRVSNVRLEPQPDDAIPRFQYEDHIQALVRDRLWPDSTRAISELRITLDYQSASGWGRWFSAGKLSIDIVDYPGEWLLDLPLLSQDYKGFSDSTVALAQNGVRAELAQEWLAIASSLDINAPADEMTARRLAESFAAYLKACKSDERSLSTLPPGRLLMPGDLEGSPALTFAPLPGLTDEKAPKGSLRAMMERRYDAYKSIVVKPFFREHFARLDRQIVLIDTLQAVNRGPEAVQDLERALGDVLACFRPGTNSLLSSLIGRRIDGAGIEVMALASVRATREATVRQDGHDLPVIVGTPMAGETINGETFDGNRKTAIFPGDLPEDPEPLFRSIDRDGDKATLPDVNVVRFRPPNIDEPGSGGIRLSVPHIRLDRAMQFLFGDKLA